MSTKKAQSIVNQVEDALGISLVSFQNSEIEWLQKKLTEFNELEVDTDELVDPSDLEYEGGDEEDTEELEFEEC